MTASVLEKKIEKFLGNDSRTAMRLSYLRIVIEREKAHLCKREGLSLGERSQNAQNGTREQ